MNSFLIELTRKLVHLSSLWIPILYLYSGKTLMLEILIPLSLIALSIDLYRRKNKSLNDKIKNIIGFIMRKNEKDATALSGATYLYIAASITIAFFPFEIAINALSILVISDIFAALIGRKFGQNKIMDKSLEGSLAFFASALMICYFYQEFYGFSLSWYKLLLAVSITTLAELYAKKIKIDDNFVIPISFGLIFLAF